MSFNLAKLLADAQAIGVIADAGIQLLPRVGEAVKAAEASIGPGNGAAKLQMVQDTLAAAYTIATGVENSFSSLLPLIDALVTAAVNAFNTAKLFTHAAAATAPAVAK